MNDPHITITFSKQEAIVFFELISRLNEKLPKTLLEDQSEQKMLMDLEALLEKNLTEPLEKEYPAILDEARKSVRDASD